MDWEQLSTKINTPPGMTSKRQKRLYKLAQVLDGTMYDCLQYPFSQESTGSGMDGYIALDKRRPSVRTNLCATVVDESVALLFAESHWPSIQATDETLVKHMNLLATQMGLQQVMSDAATRGSVGSVAVLMEAINQHLRLSVLESAYLTPVWDAGTRELVSVRQDMPCTAETLLDMGYTLPPETGSQTYFILRREWTTTEDKAYLPRSTTANADVAYIPDPVRTVRHDLGFVPIVWMRNLTRNQSSPDGICTFEKAISTVIEGDYLLSQGGRALRYQSDPLLVLKDDAANPDSGAGAHQGGAANALLLSTSGDAKLLEMNGAGAAAISNHVRDLRAIVLEQLHGNKAHADKIAASQSGRAMEMMAQSLIWLSDRLRLSYGADGILPIMAMACKFSQKVRGSEPGIYIGPDLVTNLEGTGLTLHWPPWFPQTGRELMELAQALTTAVAAGVLSRRTAAVTFANAIGADPNLEWEAVKDWVASGGTTALPGASRTAANAGIAVTREVTA